MSYKNRIHPISKKNQTFWQFMTEGFADKLYSFGCTLAMIAGIVCVHVVGTDSWGDFDPILCYPINLFFGVISFLILRNILQSVAITVVLVALSYFFKWNGFADGSCLYWLFIYWGGFYIVWSKGEPSEITKS